MKSGDVQEGERFEEMQPTGDAGAVWQVISLHQADAAHGPRAHMFNVDNPMEIRTVSLSKLLDGFHYRSTDSSDERTAAAR